MTAVKMFCKKIIIVFLMFEFSRVDGNGGGAEITEWTVPLLNTGHKRFYFGLFFKTNWYRAQQYCRYHGMHLASIASQEENDMLEQAIANFAGHNYTEFLWTSGTDLPEIGSTPRKFFWMSNGYPFTFTNWNPQDKNEKGEHCVYLSMVNTVLKWNDLPCNRDCYFICEVQTPDS